MDNNVNAAEAIVNRVGHDGAAFGRGNIRCDKQIGFAQFSRCRSSGGEDLRTSLAQSRDHRFADPLCSTRDERAAAIQFEIVAHERISSDAILSPSSVKTNSSPMGPPGEFPLSRFGTKVFASFRADASGPAG